jgi:hypothetical protein
MSEKVTFPFKTPKDEAAFYRMMAMLAPEDQDEWVKIQNRRDPSTGHIAKQDQDAISRFTEKFVFGATCE